ncbi:DUF1697 domain-containing protein [Maricaulis maris]|uniref:Uncharacterized protein (DUF1697 family) n=1 Tax=Maricaulis maris TaxID=74318 RepID=A0A495CY65_9PROT|nr:DUF1697 domain-containing protein [Maricaulis maris]RKQ94252.1 uncharacterized protein (DUF1697 family) [Maricaulis maris]
MTTHIALLRAVNVGGTGKLPMAELKSMAVRIGFENPRTYIASGNLVFESNLTTAQAGEALEAALQDYAGKPVGVIMRTPDEMQAVFAANPFPDAPGNRCVVLFLDTAPPDDLSDTLKHQAGEQVVAGKREIYIHYGDGMGQSKLVVPAAKTGTARNMNTVAKLVTMAGGEASA